MHSVAICYINYNLSFDQTKIQRKRQISKLFFYFFINIFSTQELDLISKGAFPIGNAPYVIDSELAVLMHQF